MMARGSASFKIVGFNSIFSLTFVQYFIPSGVLTKTLYYGQLCFSESPLGLRMKFNQL